MKFIGLITRLNVKTGTGRRGPWSAYSAKLEKEDGTEYEEWISFGFEKPAAEEGKWYEIEAEKDDKGYFRAKSIKAVDAPRRSAVGAANSGSNSAGSGKSGSATQQSIHYQSARKDALEFVKVAQEADALPLLRTVSKAGEAKRYQELLDVIDKLTVQFYFDAETHRLLDSVVDAGADVETTDGAISDAGKTTDEDDDQ